MRSAADELKSRSARQVEALPPAERIRLALALGDDGLAVFRAACGIDREEARRRLRRQRQVGRRASGCLALPPD